MDAVISIDGLRKSFGATKALDGISFAVDAGEMFGVIGPDGAGKTTAMRTICGLLAPDEGTVRVFGADPFRQPRKAAASIGYVSQRFTLYGDLSIDENIEFFARIHGVSDFAARRHRLLSLDGPRAVPFAARRAALRRNEAEARAGLHAGSRASHSRAGRTDNGRRSRVAPRVLEAARRIHRSGADDRDGDAVPR